MSNSGLKVKDEALREVAFGAVNASYTALGSVFAFDSFITTFVNETNANIYVSYDGTTDHHKLGAQNGRVFDYKTNDCYRIAGTQVYVKHDGTAPTSGWFGCEVQYT